MITTTFTRLTIITLASVLTAATHAAELDLSPLKNVPGLIHTSIGVTRKGTPIPAVITKDDWDYDVKKVRILLVAGLDGSKHTTAAAINVIKRYYSEAEFKPYHKAVAMSAILCGNPDGLAADLKNDNGSGGNPARGYPPKGDAYNNPTNPEAQYIWRWIGMHAPEMVVEMIEGTESGSGFELGKGPKQPDDILAMQLNDHWKKKFQLTEDSLLSWEAFGYFVRPGDLKPFAADFGKDILDAITNDPTSTPGVGDQLSLVRKEMQSRIHRTPREVCEQLAKVYGHDLPTVQYIPAVALMGRVRLGQMIGDDSHLKDVEKIVASYRDGTKPAISAKSGGSEFAGHLIFGLLADATKNKEYIPLVVAAANRAFDEQGKPREAMPSHSEMSDAVFMACPILAEAGRLTGDKKYNDMCLTHMRFMNKLNIRADGLHRHSPLDETAWGRGNGFPALGLALSLSSLPQDFAGREEMLAAFRAHLTALLKHQDPTGAWHQVIDREESYRELTATCMITFAMIRGVRQGWLDRATFEPAIRRGWYAIKSRVAADGTLVDVCTGTGKQKSLRDYYDRTAILGRDGRGGAMALLVATEMLAWEPGGKR